MRFRNYNAPKQVLKIDAVDKLRYKPIDLQRAKCMRTEEHYSFMSTRRMFAYVCKLNVQSKEHAPFRICLGSDFRVAFAEKTFLGNGAYIVPDLLKCGFEMAGQVLVQLDPQGAETFQMLSRASSAP